MNARRKPVAVLLGGAALLLAWCASAGGGDNAIARHVVAGGGGESSSARWQLRGTAGQALAQASESGRYRLQSGYWTPLARDDGLFADGFED